MKRSAVLILLIAVLLCLCGCKSDSWKGFYDEDLNKYIELVDYTKLTYKQPDVSVAVSEIDERITQMLEGRAELIPSDKALVDGMSVTLDAYCVTGGTSLPELSFESKTLELGADYSDAVLSQLAKETEGLKKGQGKEASITLPIDYVNKGDPEKQVTYRITILEVYERVVPKLTDMLAPELVPGCETVTELRDEIGKRIEKEKLATASDTINNELKEKLVSGSSLKKIPYSVYNEYYNDRMNLYERLAEASSLTLEDYVQKNMGMTLYDLKDLVSEMASLDLKESLVLYSVVKRENIVCTDEKLSVYASQMALRSEGVFASGEEYLSYYGENAVKNDYLWSEVLTKVRAKATSQDN